MKMMKMKKKKNQLKKCTNKHRPVIQQNCSYLKTLVTLKELYVNPNEYIRKKKEELKEIRYDKKSEK
jgi:hypothetical protein